MTTQQPPYGGRSPQPPHHSPQGYQAGPGPQEPIYSHQPSGPQFRLTPQKRRRRKWPIVVGGLVLLVIIIVAVSKGGGSATPDKPAGTIAATFPGATDKDIAGNAGDTLTVDGVQVTTTPLKAGQKIGSKKSLCTTATLVNPTSKPVNFNGGFDWKMQDPAGAAVNTAIFGSSKLLSAGDLAPGGQVSGDVCFENSSGASGQFVVLYDPMDFSKARGAWINPL